MNPRGFTPTPLPNVVGCSHCAMTFERNPFDFTETSAQFMPGELTVTVKPPQEI